ncbi:MAG: gamma carbonic anhydrase family protein, partial [Deltaproteobacteria bacterium]|nr:gamma carbonic anhydrase family protein [Deltaproteobacteria bacterium]
MIYSLGDKKIQIVGDDYFIADNATVIGSVIIHSDVSIWFNAVIRGDNDLITIGEGTNIQDGAVLHTDEEIPLNLGKGITVGHQAMLHGCTIGENSLIGINAVV